MHDEYVKHETPSQSNSGLHRMKNGPATLYERRESRFPIYTHNLHSFGFFCYYRKPHSTGDEYKLKCRTRNSGFISIHTLSWTRGLNLCVNDLDKHNWYYAYLFFHIQGSDSFTFKAVIRSSLSCTPSRYSGLFYVLMDF